MPLAAPAIHSRWCSSTHSSLTKAMVRDRLGSGGLPSATGATGAPDMSPRPRFRPTPVVAPADATAVSASMCSDCLASAAHLPERRGAAPACWDATGGSADGTGGGGGGARARTVNGETGRRRRPATRAAMYRRALIQRLRHTFAWPRFSAPASRHLASFNTASWRATSATSTLRRLRVRRRKARQVGQGERATGVDLTPSAPTPSYALRSQ
jgi:hypothetical protein